MLMDKSLFGKKWHSGNFHTGQSSNFIWYFSMNVHVKAYETETDANSNCPRDPIDINWSLHTCLLKHCVLSNQFAFCIFQIGGGKLYLSNISLANVRGKYKCVGRNRHGFSTWDLDISGNHSTHHTLEFYYVALNELIDMHVLWNSPLELSLNVRNDMIIGLFPKLSISITYAAQALF